MNIIRTIKLIITLWLIASFSMATIVFFLNQEVSKQNTNIQVIDELIGDIFTLNILTSDYILHQADRAQAQWETIHERILLTLSEAEFEGGQNELDSLERSAETIENVFMQLVETYEKGESDISEDFSARLVGQLSSTSQDMVSDAFLLSSKAQENIASIQKSFTLINLIFLVIVFFVTIIGGGIMLRGVARPVEALKASEKRNKELSEILRVINKILRHDVLGRLVGARESVNMFMEDKNKDWIEMTQLAVEEGINVVNQMKELEGFISSGKKLKWIEIDKMVRELARTYEIPVKIKGSGSVRADEALRSVFDNLIRNAIMHGRAQKIDLEIKKGKGGLHVRVSDDGSGVPKEIRKKIFDEGFFAGETGNTGLGLYIVKKTIERYGGSISVEENTPKGATFVIEL